MHHIRIANLPLYIVLNVHTQARSKKLVTQLLELGVNISHNRVLQLENQLVTYMYVRWDMEKKCVVCPVREGLFTWVPWTTLITIYQVPLPKVCTTRQARVFSSTVQVQIRGLFWME